jgi:4-aminobutyrate aminotransferase/(S)-3-amino-2-methylpropionate transaminase
MMAIEIIEPITGAPDATLATAVSRHCHQNGVLTLVTGTYGNVIRFLPPLSISTGALAEGLGVVADAFDTHAPR